MTFTWLRRDYWLTHDRFDGGGGRDEIHGGGGIDRGRDNPQIIAGGFGDDTINTGIGNGWFRLYGERGPGTGHTPGAENVLHFGSTRVIANGQSDNTVYVVHPASGPADHDERSQIDRFNPNGDRLVLGVEDSDVLIFHVSTLNVHRNRDGSTTATIGKLELGTADDGTPVPIGGVDFDVRIDQRAYAYATFTFDTWGHFMREVRDFVGITGDDGFLL